MRPTLLLATMSALGGDARSGAPQAMGLEMFHNFTLLHDDVMDRAELRRGRPTVHCKWDTNMAILAGDAMLTMSMQLMADCADKHLRAVIDLFNATAMGIYQGQQLDMAFETRNDVTVSEYLEMIRLKTSVLLACACATGAILAGAGAETIRRFYDYGIALGLAFQLQDDMLDTYGVEELFGKQIGGDILNDKKTWLLINAQAEDHSGRLAKALAGEYAGAEKIEVVRSVYTDLGLDKRIAALIDQYAKKAIAIASELPIDDDARKYFVDLAQDLCNRSN